MHNIPKARIHVDDGLHYRVTKTAIPERHKPKYEQPHGRISLKQARRTDVLVPAKPMKKEQRPPYKIIPFEPAVPVQKIEITMPASPEFEQAEHANVYPIGTMNPVSAIARSAYRVAIILAGVIVLGALTLLLPKPSNSQVKGKPSIVMVKGGESEASWMVMTPGTNRIAFRSGTGKVNLAKFGVENFDGTEISVPVYSNKYGWEHYVLNKNWPGVLVVKEPAVGDTVLNSFGIYSNDGSKTIDPNANRTDESGVFVIPTDRGVILRNGEMGGYVELATHFKVKKMENTSVIITIDKKTGEKIAVVSVTNSKEKVAVKLNTGEPYKLLAAG